jgi:hypothetical protein
MAPLNGTLALAEMDQVAVFVSEDLDFDVARTLDPFFEVDFTGAEGAFGFARSGAHSRFEFRFGIDAAHAFAAAAGCGLQQNGIPDGDRSGARLCIIAKAVFRTGNDRSARLDGETPRGRFGTHLLNGLRGGTDELDAGTGASSSECGIFAQEAIARVDGIGASSARGIENAFDRKIAEGRSGRPDAKRLVGHADVQCAPIGFGKDGDGGDAHVAASANDADSYFPPIGD